MESPKLYFNSSWPAFFGRFQGANWDAVTIPPMGIYFKKSKKDVPTKLFKHEMKHWYQAEKLGVAFYPVLFMDYKYNGYGRSRLEAEAKEYQKQPLTVEEEAIWAKA